MKTTVTVILIFITTLAFGQKKEMYQKLVDSLMAKGESDQLITYFDSELKKHPKNENILRWLGYIHIDKNNLDLGEKYYNQALAVNPKCARCYLNIGKAYSFRNDNKKALEYYDKAVSIAPDNALLYSERGLLKEKNGDDFGALRDHEKAIEISPKNSECYIGRGLYNSNSGYQLLAISDFTKAIELSPESYYPFYNRSMAYFRERKLDQALKDINKAIELDSNINMLYSGRAAIFGQLKEYKKAIADYSKAISLNKKDFGAYLYRSTAYYQLEDLDASCSDHMFLKAQIKNGKISDQAMIKEINDVILDICDTSKPSYYYQRGVGYYNLKEYRKAIDMYNKGTKSFPKNSMMLSFNGNAHLSLKKYEKAINLYNKALKYKDNILTELKINPRFSGASSEKIKSFYEGSLSSIYLSLSECNINLGNYDQALTDMNTALRLAPEIEDFKIDYNFRGYIYLMKGEYEKAISDFNKSIQINKKSTFTYVNLAIAKVSLTKKMKTSFRKKGNFRNQPISVTWNLPKNLSKKSKTNIESALSDCNTAIEIDEKLVYAYYIRGQIKKMLGFSDYCRDLLIAKRLGMVVENKLLINCK